MQYKVVHLYLVALVVTLFLVPSCRFFSSDEAFRNKISAGPVVRKAHKKTVVFEEPNLPEPRETAVEKNAATDFVRKRAQDIRPRVALIIDDMGYHQQIGRRLLALDLNLTFSFLPKAPYTKKQEELAWEKGHDVLLHLPMQAHGSSWDPGPGALYLKYSTPQIQALVEDDLKSVPHAIGSNNHMGSRFTENRAAMHAVLTVLKRRGLFFVDSYTTAASIGLDEARRMAVPSARRHVFLDNVQDKKKICQQLDRLVVLAMKKGWAIGIGHPHQTTLDALTDCGQRIQTRVRIVGVHTLVR